MSHAEILTNTELAHRFRRLADLLEIRGDPVFKVIAYRRAADSLAQQPESARALKERGELGAIPGVGKAIAQKIEDLFDTGTFKLWEEVVREIPPGVADLLQIPDVGPKRARQLYAELGVKGLDSLREAVEQGRLSEVSGLGSRGAQRIVEGLRSLQPPSALIPLGTAHPLALSLLAELEVQAGGLAHSSPAGGVRRRCEAVSDVAFVVAHSRPDSILSLLSTLPTVAEVEPTGERAAAARLHTGARVTLTVCEPRSFGAVLHHWTGSREYITRLAAFASERGYELTEFGLTSGGELETFEDERALYERLGMQYVPPTMREDADMVDAAAAGEVPVEIEVSMLHGDLHSHSTWSDGQHTIREMAKAARARGYEYLCVTDHSQSLGVANGLSPERLAAQRVEIEAVNQELAPFRLLQGVELEVRGDGSLDLPDETLAALDIVVASVHTGLRQERDRLTSRALSAIRSPYVDVLAHPTGRIVGGRAGGDFDMDALIAEAARTGTILEINSDPARLDLRDTHAHQALVAGCTLSIDSDAHTTDGLGNVWYGADVASRARATVGAIHNALTLTEMLAGLKRHRLRN